MWRDKPDEWSLGRSPPAHVLFRPKGANSPTERCDGCRASHPNSPKLYRHGYVKVLASPRLLIAPSEALPSVDRLSAIGPSGQHRCLNERLLTGRGSVKAGVNGRLWANCAPSLSWRGPKTSHSRPERRTPEADIRSCFKRSFLTKPGAHFCAANLRLCSSRTMRRGAPLLDAAF